MAEITVTGKIEHIGDVQRISEKLTKRTIVVTTADKYPQSIPMELINDKCSLAEKVSIGSDVTANVNLKGRKWTNPQGEVKYFGSNECWRLEVIGNQSAPQDETGNNSVPLSNEDLSNQLPF